MFNSQQLEVIQFCAKSCERQSSGEFSVYDMIQAYEFLTRISPPGRPFPKRMTVAVIEQVGRLVEPVKNVNGFRRVQTFKRLDESDVLIPIGSPPENIERHLILLTPDEFSPEEFYQEFEGIHPFLDGNGRTGELIFNYMNQTLDNLVVPPDYRGPYVHVV